MKVIRIIAKCPFFEINEEVKENHVVKRLKQIRDLFTNYKESRSGFVKKADGGKALIGDEKLTVTIEVTNPSLF